jgi:hypothetical protein
MPRKQDLFISHADSDKERYILPLTAALADRGITFWLDTFEIGLGDNFVLKINDGLRKSRFALLYLSKNFLGSSWAENEMSSVLAMQNSAHSKKVLPIILDSKNKILRFYPILKPLIYKEFKVGVCAIAEEIKALTGRKSHSSTDVLHIILESVHSGKLSNLHVQRRSSIKWLEEKARISAGIKDSVNVGALEKLLIRWVLVDVNAEADWKLLSASEMAKIKALVKSSSGLKASYRYEDRLEDIGVYDGITFRLYAIPEVDQGTEQYRSGSSFTGGSSSSRGMFKFQNLVWRRPPDQGDCI